MIDYRYIQKKREETGIPEETLEKDFFIELMLYYLLKNRLFRTQLVFRGGTALKKVYFSDFRYSEDMDFITENRSNLSKVLEAVQNTVKSINRDYPIKAEIAPDASGDGRLQLFVSYDIVSEITAEKSLKIDIVQDNAILPSKTGSVLFTYADFMQSTGEIMAYRLESIAAEKIGRIFDNIFEPRDIWDLWYLFRRNTDIAAVKRCFFEKYGIALSVERLISSVKSPVFEKSWNIRLSNHVIGLAPLGKVLNELEKAVRK